MTRVRIDWDYDPEERRALRQELDTDRGDRFFAAWLNPGTEAVEWICTDLEYPGGPHFEELVAVMVEEET